MFSHVMVGTNDLERSKAFYDAVLGVIDVPPGRVDRHRVFWSTSRGVFAVSVPINGEAATSPNGGTIGFACGSTDAVDAWHAAGLAAGGTTIEDPPGIRESPYGSLYVAYLRDPDGNKLCAAHRPR